MHEKLTFPQDGETLRVVAENLEWGGIKDGVLNVHQSGSTYKPTSKELDRLLDHLPRRAIYATTNVEDYGFGISLHNWECQKGCGSGSRVGCFTVSDESTAFDTPLYGKVRNSLSARSYTAEELYAIKYAIMERLLHKGFESDLREIRHKLREGWATENPWGSPEPG